MEEKHTKNVFHTELDEINGLGAKRKMALFKNFSSIDEIKNAPVEKFKALGFPDALIKEIKDKLNKEEMNN